MRSTPDRPAMRLGRAQVLRYRARVSHLDAKLPPGSFAAAAWGGLQDTLPRAGIVSLHARVEATPPDAWEHPSVVQVWFRGADYLVPRADAGVFTLGSYPRDPSRAAELERIADDVHRVTVGRITPVREAAARLGQPWPIEIRRSAITGRVHIRWDAADIWLIPVERPAIDAEDARRELARRFLHWFAPTTVAALARWTGVEPRDARATWAALEDELVAVEMEGTGERRWVLAADLDALRAVAPLSGVRLVPRDDPLTKLDQDLVVPDPVLRRRVLPRTGESPGYTANAVLVDGEIAGAWQRQQHRVTIHPFGRLSAAVRDAIEREAHELPIPGGTPTVAWDEP